MMVALSCLSVCTEKARKEADAYALLIGTRVDDLGWP